MLITIPELLTNASQGIRKIDAKTAFEEINENTGILIDVREPAEHNANPATGAINIPRGLLEMKILELESDPAKPIYLHCATSARATLSAEQLMRLGFENVTVLTCKMDTIIEQAK